MLKSSLLPALALSLALVGSAAADRGRLFWGASGASNVSDFNIGDLNTISTKNINNATLRVTSLRLTDNGDVNGTAVVIITDKSSLTEIQLTPAVSLKGKFKESVTVDVDHYTVDPLAFNRAGTLTETKINRTFSFSGSSSTNKGRVSVSLSANKKVTSRAGTNEGRSFEGVTSGDDRYSATLKITYDGATYMGYITLPEPDLTYSTLILPTDAIAPNIRFTEYTGPADIHTGLASETSIEGVGANPIEAGKGGNTRVTAKWWVGAGQTAGTITATQASKSSFNYSGSYRGLVRVTQPQAQDFFNAKNLDLIQLNENVGGKTNNVIPTKETWVVRGAFSNTINTTYNKPLRQAFEAFRDGVVD